jgi:hypothetical protein
VGLARTEPYRSPSAEGIPAHFKDPQGYWTGFSARARVLIANQTVPDKPKSITSYADPASKGRAVIANPLFGTTTAEINIPIRSSKREELRSARVGLAFLSAMMLIVWSLLTDRWWLVLALAFAVTLSAILLSADPSSRIPTKRSSLC